LKSDHEIDVFIEFAQVNGMSITRENIEPRQPPEPDLRLKAPEGHVYFELGRILDPEMQRARLHAMRSAPTPVAAANYDVKLPERQVLKRKIAAAYETNGAPIELLLYYDNADWLVGGFPW
jgi:hypothetical protein